MSALKWPATAAELLAANYLDAHGFKVCACGEHMFWFLTPNRKYIPLSVAPVDPDRLCDPVAVFPVRYMPHHAVCKNVKDFRAANQQHAARVEPPKPKQETLF